MGGAHASTAGRKKWPVILGVVVVVFALAGASVAYLSSRPSTTAAPVTHVPTTLAVLASTPTNNTTVDSNASIRISFNQPLAANSPMPTLQPTLAGHWEELSPTTLVFVQTSPWQPGQTVTVTVPGGAGGVRGIKGATLASTTTSTFNVAPLSLLRVQQLLAELGYLPLTFTPTVPVAAASVPTADEQGTFSWRWSTLPSQLTSQWSPGQANAITQGAIMRFEDVHNMTTDGQAGPAVWQALLADRAAGHVDADPYNDVLVSQSIPESLQLYSNGAVVFTTAVNTGVAGATTDVGTFPVYLRYRVTTMSGTNPDGTKYHDPGIPWVSYFHGGDALHGFVRSSYGTPQSVGCVEMTFANAAVVWPQTPIGTLVTVEP